VSTLLASDSFNRTVSNGWGTADVGGAWNTTGPKYAVSPGSATIQADATTPSNFLTAVSAQDVDVRAKISPAPISSSYPDNGIAVRYSATGGTWYQLNAYDAIGNNNSDYTVQLKRKPDNTQINPDFNTTIPGGTPIWLRLQAQGTNPTVLRWKIWQDGTTEPTSWTGYGTDNTAALQGPGGVGVVTYVNTGSEAAAFNSFTASRIPSS
jgi:hypothetical protein